MKAGGGMIPQRRGLNNRKWHPCISPFGPYVITVKCAPQNPTPFRQAPTLWNKSESKIANGGQYIQFGCKWTADNSFLVCLSLQLDR